MLLCRKFITNRSLQVKIDQLTRCCSSSKKSDESTTTRTVSEKLKIRREQIRKDVNRYVFFAYLGRVQNYENVLEKKFPKTVKAYRIFFDGMKDLFKDMKRYLKIAKIVHSSPKGLQALNRQELELYMQMPRDMVKVAPAIIVSSLPFVGYTVFPLIFGFPRVFLTHHFWTAQQKEEFQHYYATYRLSYNKPVFRLLQSKLEKVQNDPQVNCLDNIFGLIGSGFHPTVESILQIKSFFAKPPFEYHSLSTKHIKNLMYLHGLRAGLNKRLRLYEHGFLVHSMDVAIKKEGGVHNMPETALIRACYIRGLNTIGLTNDEMIEWLRNWVEVSLNIEEQHISLFLHLPIFLGYNHPNNWRAKYGNTN